MADRSGKGTKPLRRISSSGPIRSRTEIPGAINAIAPPLRSGSLMDFVLDYISVNTFWTILSTTHALLAVALLGALTHQRPRARTAARRRRRRFRHALSLRVGPRYAAAVCVLWVLVSSSAPGFT